ncbi:MAG: hypothetical protein ACRC2V_01665 [Xenococcaceae cyanobacterium]
MPYIRTISEQVYDEAIESNNFKISMDFPNIPNVQDMIEYPGVPSPNIAVCFMPKIPNSLIQEIADNDNYGDGCILLTGDNEGEIPSQSEFNEIRDFLLNKLTEDPPTISQLDEAIGTSPNGKTRWEISQDLIAYLKNR